MDETWSDPLYPNYTELSSIPARARIALRLRRGAAHLGNTAD
jgi:hypothetical protein